MLQSAVHPATDLRLQDAQHAAAAEQLAAERQQVSQLQDSLAAALADRDQHQVY
jgi:hypothetical protein